MTTFEVLTRRPDGHETVHRFEAADAEEAKALAVEAGVPADQIVDAAVEDGSPEEVRAAPPADVSDLIPEPEPAEPEAED
jgi:hypothetical protein